MKSKRNSLIQLAILCVLGLSVVLTLLLPELPSSRNTRPTAEVSVLMREGDTALFSNVRLGMEQAAIDLGTELRVLTPTTNNSHLAQRELLLREVSGGASALVITPADSLALGSFIKNKAIEIPIVTMESTVEGAVISISPDNNALGHALAEAYLADNLGETVLLLDTSEGSGGVTKRVSACTQTLRDAGKIVAVRTTTTDSLTEALPLLVSESGASAIIAFDHAATEALATYVAYEDPKPMLYGVGGTATIAACLERNALSAVVAWNDYAAGYLAVQAATQVALSLPLQESDALSFTTIRGEDIYDPDHQKLLFPVIY